MSNLTTSKGVFWIPAILSGFIPGLGQLIKGQFLKAVVVWAFVGIVHIIFGWIPILWLIYGIAWLANVLDAAFSRTKD